MKDVASCPNLFYQDIKRFYLSKTKFHLENWFPSIHDIDPFTISGYRQKIDAELQKARWNKHQKDSVWDKKKKQISELRQSYFSNLGLYIGIYWQIHDLPQETDYVWIDTV